MEIVVGDIAAEAVDAVVNAANSELWMGSGVAGALKRLGGEEIEREAMLRGPIRAGEAVETGAGRLPARYVIHAAAMGPDLRTSATLVQGAATSALAVASRLGLARVSMPALGTGVGGFPMPECGRIMRRVLEASTHAPTSVSLVRFVLRSPEDRAAFERGFDSEPTAPAP